MYSDRVRYVISHDDISLGVDSIVKTLTISHDYIFEFLLSESGIRVYLKL